MQDEKQSADRAWTVDYADHSGNRYRFWQAGGEDKARFSYDPITPEQSSSGTYSGGEPREGTLDPAQVESLFEQVRMLEERVESHATMRMKGTGSLRIREGSGAPRRFLIRNGQSRQDFDRFLEPFR